MVTWYLIFTFDCSDRRVYYYDLKVEAKDKSEALDESLACVRKLCTQNEWQLKSCNILEIQDRRN